MNKKLLFTLFSLSICFFVNAQNYVLDNTFGTSGIGYTEFNSGVLAPDYLNAAAKTPDGNTVITGYTTVGGRNYFTIAKVTETGYDTSFGGMTTGISLLTLQSPSWPLIGEGKDIVVQTDGKIVAVGWQNINNSAYAYNGSVIIVARLNSDGTLDTSFNGTGIQTININGFDNANTVALQNDGKIVVGGYTKNGSIFEAIVVRLNIDGSLDTSFDTDGIVTLTTGNNDDRFNDIAIQTDGKIIACGQNSSFGSLLDFMTVRFHTNGSLDTSFNNTGIVYTNFDISSDIATCLTIQSDNKILVGGYTNSSISGNYSKNLAVARYNINGSLDATFSGDGKLSVGFEYDDEIINSISISGSRIYLGGYYNDGSANLNDFFIVALTSSGNFDNTYNGQGFALYNTGFDDKGVTLVQHATYTSLFGNSNNKFSYYKLSNSNSFLYDNKLIDDFSNLSLSKNTNELFTLNNSKNDYNVVKFSSLGVFDSSFGNSGIINIPNEYLNGNDAVFKETFDSKLLVSGYEKIYRFNSNGTLDTTLSGSGILNLPLLAGESIFIDDIICLPNNSFYVITDKGDNNNYSHTTVFKYNSNGTLDTSYGVNGISEIFSINTEIPHKALIKNDGKIIILGASFTNTWYKLFSIRLNQDGTPDNSYGVNGKIIYNINDISIYPNSMKLQDDGKLLAVFGYQQSQQPGEFCILRFNIDGSLDTSYNGTGIAHTLISQSSGANDFIILNDGKTLLAGSSTNNGQSYLTLVRYNTNGTLDTTFGTNGVFQDIPNGSSNYGAWRIRIETDEKITVVANTYGVLNRSMTLVRYILDLNLGAVDFSNTKEQSYIYPNPIIEETNLVYTLNKETLITVELYDLQGKLVKNYFKKELKSIGKHDEKIILPNYLQSGNYILKISSPEGSTSIKLIKK